MDWVYIVIGLVLLVFAGDALVKGAVNMALRLGVPALIVSLTVVSFGTSAPELLISIQSVLSGASGLAVGNVVGSNIANVWLVLGLPALIAVMHTSAHDTRSSYLMMIGSTLIFIALAARGSFTWVEGLFMLALLVAMLTYEFFRQSKQASADEEMAEHFLEEIEEADPDMPWWRVAVFLGVGLIGLPIGAQFLVEGSVNIARQFGVSETVIGLTLVAIGTSLPELATTVMAVLRKQADVALGNVIGSNIFNLLAIIGGASLFGTITVTDHVMTFDVWVMLLAALMLIPFVYFKRDIGKLTGVLFLSIYTGYLIVLL